MAKYDQSWLRMASFCLMPLQTLLLQRFCAPMKSSRSAQLRFFSTRSSSSISRLRCRITSSIRRTPSPSRSSAPLNSIELYRRPSYSGFRLRATRQTLAIVRWAAGAATEASVFSFGRLGSRLRNSRYSMPLLSCSLWERAAFSNSTFLPMYCPCRNLSLRTRLPRSVCVASLASPSSMASSQLLVALGLYSSLTISLYSLARLSFSRGSSVLLWRSWSSLRTAAWECPLQSSLSLAALASALFLSVSWFCSRARSAWQRWPSYSSLNSCSSSRSMGLNACSFSFSTLAFSAASSSSFRANYSSIALNFGFCDLNSSQNLRNFASSSCLRCSRSRIRSIRASMLFLRSSRSCELFGGRSWRAVFLASNLARSLSNLALRCCFSRWRRARCWRIADSLSGSYPWLAISFSAESLQSLMSSCRSCLSLLPVAWMLEMTSLSLSLPPVLAVALCAGRGGEGAQPSLQGSSSWLCCVVSERCFLRMQERSGVCSL